MDWNAREIGLRIGGHRGDPENAHENTLAAFVAGLEAGVDYLETDVQRTRDGVLVLLHDDTVDRTTDGTGRIADLDIHDVHALDAGGGQRILTVEEFLEWIHELNAPAELDVKAPGIGADLARLVAASPARPLVSLCSAIAGELAAAKEVLPDLPCFLILEERPPDVVAAVRACGADGADLPWEWLDDALVRRMRESAVAIMGSTASDERSLRELLRVGADFVDSDRPRLALAVRDGT
jgi:glycerophosphoryl diester phosphodiesterase